MKHVPANLEAFEVHERVVVEDLPQWHPISRPAHLILTKPELRMKQICGFVVERFRHIHLLLKHSRLNPGRQVFTRTPKKVFFLQFSPYLPGFCANRLNNKGMASSDTRLAKTTLLAKLVIQHIK